MFNQLHVNTALSALNSLKLESGAMAKETVLNSYYGLSGRLIGMIVVLQQLVDVPAVEPLDYEVEK